MAPQLLPGQISQTLASNQVDPSQLYPLPNGRKFFKNIKYKIWIIFKCYTNWYVLLIIQINQIIRNNQKLCKLLNFTNNKSLRILIFYY